LYTNADCFFNKLQELKQLLSTIKVKPNIIAITEVKYKSNITFSISELNLDGYKIFSNNFDKIQSRGIIVYIADVMDSEVVDFESQFNEFLFVHIKCQSGCTLLLGTIYRSPNSKADNDIMLHQLINQACTQRKNELIILGDFNFNSIDWNNWESTTNDNAENLFLSNLRDNFLLQHVHAPTMEEKQVA
jgi:hypothetical protein